MEINIRRNVNDNALIKVISNYKKLIQMSFIVKNLILETSLLIHFSKNLKLSYKA